MVYRWWLSRQVLFCDLRGFIVTGTSVVRGFCFVMVFIVARVICPLSFLHPSNSSLFLLRFYCSSREHQFHIQAKAYTLAVAIYAFLSNFFVGASFPPRILFASPLERRTFSKPGVCSLVGTERRADLGHAPRFTSISVHVTHFFSPSLSLSLCGF